MLLLPEESKECTGKAVAAVEWPPVDGEPPSTDIDDAATDPLAAAVAAVVLSPGCFFGFLVRGPGIEQPHATNK